MSTIIFPIEDADPDWNIDQLDDAPPPSRVTSDPFRLHEQERSVSVRMTTLSQNAPRDWFFWGSKRPTLFLWENLTIL